MSRTLRISVYDSPLLLSSSKICASTFHVIPAARFQGSTKTGITLHNTPTPPRSHTHGQAFSSISQDSALPSLPRPAPTAASARVHSAGTGAVLRGRDALVVPLRLYTRQMLANMHTVAYSTTRARTRKLENACAGNQPRSRAVNRSTRLGTHSGQDERRSYKKGARLHVGI